ncbi:hypothetical protein B0H14DRAFT_2762596 [Mycena olivaceomarginata]|nr:hypothetical protein B0H14DRAFT_2762596 [Mycena olivaceomarginata]
MPAVLPISCHQKPNSRPQYQCISIIFLVESPWAHPYLSAIVVNNGSQPEYTCPKCRTPVLTKPMEDYSLKEIVQTVSGTEMEERGKFESGQGSNGEMHWQKQKEKAGPFDDFFGRAQS